MPHGCGAPSRAAGFITTSATKDLLMWDQRYSSAGYAYGTAPNDFLAAHVDMIPPGPVLDLGCGEGRNAVFLAERGYAVTAVDQSAAGLRKAEQLAAQRGVTLTTVQADLGQFTIRPDHWAGIVSIFCHLPSAVRLPLYASLVRGLRPGDGVLLMEAYTPAQVGRGTGGPSDPDWMMSLDRLKNELPGLDWLLAEERQRDVREGSFHTGPASVVQFIGRRAPHPRPGR
jgi:SAM-dependent methyltransferase